MKTFLLIFSLLFALPVNAQNTQGRYEPKFKSSLPPQPTGPDYGGKLPSECRYYTDSVVVLEFGQWGMFPTSLFVKEGDRVCFIARSISPYGVTFRMENYPIGGSIKGEGDRGFTFVARKIGRHKVSCIGTCNASQAEFVVLSKAEYKKMEEEANKLRSLDSRPRHLIGP